MTAFNPRQASQGQALQRIHHDLNSPVGTLGLELYSLAQLASRLEGAMGRKDWDELNRGLGSLHAISTNLHQAHETLRALVDEIEEMIRPSSSTGSPPIDPTT